MTGELNPRVKSHAGEYSEILSRQCLFIQVRIAFEIPSSVPFEKYERESGLKRSLDTFAAAALQTKVYWRLESIESARVNY